MPLRIRSSAAFIAIAALAVALAACSTPSDPGSTTAPAGVAETVASADCLSSGLRYFSDLGFSEAGDAEEHPAAPAAGSVPKGFTATQAVLCTGEMGAVIDGETWSAVRETRYDGDLGPLLAALAVPSDPPTDGPCTADYEIVPELWLVTEEGEAVRAAWPTDSCGKTKLGVRAALDALEVIAENLLPVAPVAGDAPLDAMCQSDLPSGIEVGDGGAVTDVAPTSEPVPGATQVPGAAADAICP